MTAKLRLEFQRMVDLVLHGGNHGGSRGVLGRLRDGVGGSLSLCMHAYDVRCVNECIYPGICLCVVMSFKF
jgi:hypothetical protein